ncbi:MAG: hypothetical protein JSV79_11975 [Armatimonadota bacterium]|nr:MAG: hypothetical protein JSV79_11975 [Armatimonadota bacterium]
MVDDERREGGCERWWALGRAYATVWRVFLAAFAGISVFHLIDPLAERTQGVLYFAVGAVVFSYIFGRVVTVAVCFQHDTILVRRLFPGWVERVPASRIAYGVHLTKAHPLHWARLGVDAESVILVGWTTMPVAMGHTYRTASDGTPRDAKADWFVLVDCLRDFLEPRGRWQLLEGPFEPS